jgi:hypothetical protein
LVGCGLEHVVPEGTMASDSQNGMNFDLDAPAESLKNQPSWLS